LSPLKTSIEGLAKKKDFYRWWSNEAIWRTLQNEREKDHYCSEMMDFSCRHRSVSLHIFLISVVLMLNAPAGRCGCSLIDTGNFARSGPIMEYPFGMTYFHHPTGRISDGRVLIDFYGEYCNDAQTVHIYT
jgi:hypothetical protein